MNKIETKNSVFIATSLDGFIADKNGGIEWLNSVPNLDKIDTGYEKFMSEIDALVMGRITFETVCGFDVDWPYDKPVFVLSNTLKELPKELENKAWLVHGAPPETQDHIHNKGYYRLYIDGGTTIQSFLKEDLIDDIVITIIPILLGGGSPLFSDLPQILEFECTKSNLFLDQVVQNHYTRRRESTKN